MTEWCSASEALALLTVSRSTFQRLVKAGELPQGARFGAKLCRRWRRKDLEAFIRRREEEGR